MFESQFLKNFTVYFGGAMAVAFFNYLFYPLLGRVLPLSSFGEVQALVAMIAQLGVVFGALSVVVIHIVARPGDGGDKASTISTLRKIVLWCVSAGALSIIVLRGPMASFFHFESSLPFIALGILLFATTLPLFRNAYLQGTKQFLRGSVSSSMTAVGRIAFALLLIALGWGVFGAVLGIALANILSWGYLAWVTWRAPELTVSSHNSAPKEKGTLSRELRYGALALVANASITIFYTSDVLFMKHYFDPQTAGLYAAVSAIANICYFMLATLGAVLLPSVAGDSDTRHSAIKTALLVYLALALPMLIIFWLFHGLIITVLFGARYLPLSYVLPITATSATLVALATILNSYFLALRRIELVYILPSGVLLLVILNVLHHASVLAVVFNFLITSTLMVISLGFLYLKEYRREIQKVRPFCG